MRCLAVPAREVIPKEQPVVVILDSGGGSFLHLSPKLLKVALDFNLRPFYLPAWTTKALMPLDKGMHSTMARVWKQFRQQWSYRAQPLTLYVALRAASEIVDAAHEPHVVRASWAQTGWRSGERFDSDKIFQERAAEIFVSVRDAPQDDGAPASLALSMVSKMLPERKKHSCGSWISLGDRFCAGCGEQNAEYDSAKAELLRTGHRKRWRKAENLNQPEEEEDAATDDVSRGLMNQLDDLLSELRKKKASSGTSSSSAPATSSQVPLAQQAAPPAEPPTADSSKEVPAEPEELDLENVEQAITFISLHWSESNRPKVLPGIRFWVNEQKALASKKEPLSHIIQKKLVKSCLLSKRADRDKWLASVQANRKNRFVAKPPKK